MSLSGEEKAKRQRLANRRWYEKNKDKRRPQCREYQRKRHAENGDHVKALQNAWNEKNKERISARRALVRPKYKERERASGKKWAARNKERITAYRIANIEKWRVRYTAWAKANPHKPAALAAARRARRKNATPPWASKEGILQFYRDAERLTLETGIAHEVDHYFPLKSTIVCGLHCEDNLRVITAAENSAKHNKCPEQ